MRPSYTSYTHIITLKMTIPGTHKEAEKIQKAFARIIPLHFDGSFKIETYFETIPRSTSHIPNPPR